jgi:[acyl-carrier-protein] S-malonyltransferase
MAKIALVFPGQGSQYAGMGRDLFEKNSHSRQVFEEADAALGISLSELCFEGPDEALQLTENTQPAILTKSIACFRALKAEEINYDFVAGHSLGEYSALVAAGSISLADAVRLVRLRGSLMQQAVPSGEGAMAAILGLDAKTVLQVCVEAAKGEICSPANFNSPSQTVIAGNAHAVSRAVAIAKSRGARHTVMLNVSAPFHCALMQKARDGLKGPLEEVNFKDLETPLVNNVDAAVITSGEAARDGLVRQVTAPVRWTELVVKLVSEGVNVFVEVGPKKVLSGLIKSINREVRLLHVEDEKTLNSTIASLNREMEAGISSHVQS